MNYIVILFFIPFIVYAQHKPMSIEESKEYHLKQIQGLIPEQMYLKIKNMKFQKYIFPTKDNGWTVDYGDYYEKIQADLDSFICENKLPEVIEIAEVADFFNALRRSSIKFSDTIPCNQNSKDSISISDLNEVFNKLRNKKIFNNDHPNGLCFSRTYLISKELDGLGFKSKQLQIEGWVLGAFKRTTEKGDYFGAEGYPIHKTNLITVETESGLVDYVIDPMYFDRPIPLTEYKALISIPSIKNHYSILPQDDNESLYRGPYFSREKIINYKNCTYNKFLLDEETAKVKLPADEFFYREKYKKIERDKFQSREKALEDAKNRIENSTEKN